MSSVVVESQGGIGNQLFIYAFGRQLARDLNVNLVIDTWKHRIHPNRQFAISPVVRGASVITYGAAVPQGLTWLALRIRDSRLRRGWLSETILESNLDRHLLRGEPLPLRPGRYSGYFQSIRLFQDVSQLLRQELVEYRTDALAPLPSLQDLARDEPVVAVHVRRGDFRNWRHRRRHPLLGVDYYRSALERIYEQDANAVPIIFSDEPAAAFELISRAAPWSRPYLYQQQSSDLLQLLHMSQADFLVAANSTFSWWACFIKGFSSSRTLLPMNAPDYQIP